MPTSNNKKRFRSITLLRESMYGAPVSDSFYSSPEEQDELDSLYSEYSDRYKDEHGMRPRHINPENLGENAAEAIEKLREMLDDLILGVGSNIYESRYRDNSHKNNQSYSSLRSRLRKIISEEISNRRIYRKIPSLSTVIFEEMSEKDAIDAIKKNVTKPLERKSSKKTVEDIVAFLNSDTGKDEKVRELLKMGASDGDPGDEALTVAVKDINPAINARPTQSQIGLPNSVGYVFTTKGKSALIEALSGHVNAPSVAAAGSGAKDATFIVDGHHRWSSSIVANPDVSISVSMIDASDPFKALAISQVVIAAWQGPGKDLPSSTSEPDTNLLVMGEEEIKDYLIKSVGTVLDKGASEFLSDDILDLLAKYEYGETSVKDDRNTKIDKICSQIASNCKKVPKPSDAPPRSKMPQFDPKVQGPNLKSVEGMFTAGDANFKTPIVPEARRTRTDDAVVLERWQRLAGLIKS